MQNKCAPLPVPPVVTVLWHSSDMPSTPMPFRTGLPPLEPDEELVGLPKGWVVRTRFSTFTVNPDRNEAYYLDFEWSDGELRGGVQIGGPGGWLTLDRLAELIGPRWVDEAVASEAASVALRGSHVAGRCARGQADRSGRQVAGERPRRPHASYGNDG